MKSSDDKVFQEGLLQAKQVELDNEASDLKIKKADIEKSIKEGFKKLVSSLEK